MRHAAVVTLLLLLAGCGVPETGNPPPATTLIALDGADWRNALPLIRQGKLPVLAALQHAGASGKMLTNPDYRWSPVLWTTVATGKLPEKHGVTRFMAQVEGLDRLVPTPSVIRKCRALWTIFSEAGLTTGFVGWWVTWPAEPVNGFMVTDHFSVSRFDLGREFERDIDESAFYEGQTHPEELAERLQPLKVPRQNIGPDDLARFSDLPEDFVWPSVFEKFDKVSEFAIAHSVDRTHFGVAQALLEEERPALFGVFFQGIDILQHFFWEYMDPIGTGTRPSPGDRAAFGQTVERYYGFADSLVAELIVTGGDDRAVIIVSDHGFRPSTERWEDKHISGEHRRQAFFLWAGPGVRRGHSVTDADAVDVTPSILAYHGLAVADDMDGEPLLGALTDARRADFPEKRIDTYEVGEFARGVLPGESASRDLEERIRSLGYIE